MNSAHARTHILVGFKRTFNRDATQPEAQILQGIGLLETGWGSGWGGAGVGSHNWGAIQSGRLPCDPATSFEYKDSHPNADGSSTSYSICFRKYPDDDAGAADLARVAYQLRATVLAAASKGDILGVSTALRETGYYEGFGKTQADRINNHYKSLLWSCQLIARNLGEPMADGSWLSPRTLRLRSPWMVGEDVKRVQLVVGAKADGIYGPITTKLVKAFQTARPGLTVDGIVGPQTWQAIFSASSSATMARHRLHHF